MSLPPPRRRAPAPPPDAERPAPPPAPAAARLRFVDAGKTTPAPAREGPPPTAAWRETEETRRERERRAAAATHRAVRSARRATILRLVLLGGLAFLVGWGARNEAWIPGVFLASSLGVPIVLVITLHGVARIMRAGIRDPDHARPVAALARGGAWSLGLFWAFITMTNVPQLAVGIAVAVLAFALFWSRDRLARAGYPGYGAALRHTVVLLAAYPGWVLLRELFGPMAFFDPTSFLAVYALAFATLSSAARRAHAAGASAPSAEIAARARENAAGSARSARFVVFLVSGYLIFTFFISPAIPYGPVVEWFVVALAPLLFVLVAASRIGTVATKRALPPADVRTHEQRVFSLPDHHLAEVEARLAAYVRNNQDRDWLHAYYLRLLAQSVPEERYRPTLDRIRTRRSVESTRRALIAELAALLDEGLPETEPRRPTDMLKTNAPVAGSGATRSAVRATAGP